MKYFTYSLFACLLSVAPILGCAKAEEPDPVVFKFKSHDAGPDSDTGIGDYDAGVVPDYDHLKYHGGPVITGTANVYLIWYGDFGGSVTKSLITKFLNDFSSSEYYKINSLYHGVAPIPNNAGPEMFNKTSVSVPTADNVVVVTSIDNDKTKYGTALSTSNVRDIVQDALISERLPLDDNGIYFVLTDPDVEQVDGWDRFCQGYCGWHAHFKLNDTDVRYAFVGDPLWCPDACAPEQNGFQSPSGNVGADGMVSVIAHELEETVTDPSLNAWFSDFSGGENADLCAWTFGPTYKVSNGSYANMNINGVDYLIQQNWVNSEKSGVCALHL